MLVKKRDVRGFVGFLSMRFFGLVATSGLD